MCERSDCIIGYCIRVSSQRQWMDIQKRFLGRRDAEGDCKGRSASLIEFGYASWIPDINEFECFDFVTDIDAQ
jgi:hypothetical protein